MADNSKVKNEEFEKKLCRVADELRGNMDASEYKHIILGLIFLKYISDRFELNTRNLLMNVKDLKITLMNTYQKVYSLCPKLSDGNM